MDTTATTTYYQDLLLSQYVDKPNARATIAMLVQNALCDLVALDVNNAFDIDTAVGPQLDVLGLYIGFSRIIYGTIERPYMRYPDYETYSPSSPLEGMTDYADSTVNSDSVFYRYQFANESVVSLQDDEYRYMLKLKVALNNSDNTLYSIQNILFDFLGTDIVLWDLADMTISYAVKSTAGRFIEIAASQNLLPKPAGVALSGVFKVPDPLAVFGMESYITEIGNTYGFSDYLTGWNGQHFISYTDAI